MPARNAGKRLNGQAPAPTGIETLNEAARRYLRTVLEHADWIGQELGHCLSPTYRPNAVLADNYCKTLRWRLRPTLPAEGQIGVGLVDGVYRVLRVGRGGQGFAPQAGEEIDMNPLAGYGVEPISLLSMLSRNVLGEDFPRATSWLWRLLDQLPADVWTSGQPPAANIVDDWQKATAMLRGCLAAGLIAKGDDFADVEGLPVEIAAILKRGDFPTLADDEYAKLGAWLTAHAHDVYHGLDPANVAKTRRMEEARKRLRAILEYNAALRQARKGKRRGDHSANTDMVSVQEAADVCCRSKGRISQLCNEHKIRCRGKGFNRRVSLVSAQAYFAKAAREKTSKSNATLARDARKDARDIEREA